MTNGRPEDMSTRSMLIPNIWVWWSIGWTLCATLLVTRFHFRLPALIVGVLVGALLPRVLERCEGISTRRRWGYIGLAVGMLALLFWAGPRGWLPRFVARIAAVALPGLLAGLVVNGFFPRAQPVVRRGLGIAVAFGALMLALWLAPQPWRRYTTPVRIAAFLWPIALMGVAAVPPARWQRRDLLPPA